MKPGRLLHSLAHSCPDRARVQILEPLIADLQHEWIDTARIGRLLRAYAAFWRSFAWCLACDAWSPESREFRHRAAAGFLIAVGATVALEWLMYGSQNYAFVVTRAPYFFWRARTMTFTLCFGVPLAMFPALLRARTSNKRLVPPAGIAIIAVGMLLTIASSGWIAPAVERWQVIRVHEESVRYSIARGGRIYVQPLEWRIGRNAQAKSWPDLILDARKGPAHRFPGYPRYVAIEDQGAYEMHWRQIYERIFVVVLGVLVALLGWILGARGPMTSTATIGWWLALSIIATEGQRGGVLLPLIAISAALAITAYRKVWLKPDTTTS